MVWKNRHSKNLWNNLYGTVLKNLILIIYCVWFIMNLSSFRIPGQFPQYFQLFLLDKKHRFI